MQKVKAIPQLSMQRACNTELLLEEGPDLTHQAGQSHRAQDQDPEPFSQALVSEA